MAHTQDIVEQLRDRAYSTKFTDTLLAHAADEIERLRRVTESMPKEKRAEVSAEPVIGDDRLAALEELSALDQKLELKHGITGNPMIKAQPCKAAKTDTTHPRNGTPAEGSVQGDGTEPAAWAVENGGFEYVSLLRESAEYAALKGEFAHVVPLYRQPSPALTDAEREAIAVAMHRCDGPEYKTLRALLERMK